MARPEVRTLDEASVQIEISGSEFHRSAVVERFCSFDHQSRSARRSSVMRVLSSSGILASLLRALAKQWTCSFPDGRIWEAKAERLWILCISNLLTRVDWSNSLKASFNLTRYSGARAQVCWSVPRKMSSWESSSADFFKFTRNLRIEEALEMCTWLELHVLLSLLRSEYRPGMKWCRCPSDEEVGWEKHHPLKDVRSWS